MNPLVPESLLEFKADNNRLRWVISDLMNIKAKAFEENLKLQAEKNQLMGYIDALEISVRALLKQMAKEGCRMNSDPVFMARSSLGQERG